jgi:cell wall-associated NlpC family hydrolase
MVSSQPPTPKPTPGTAAPVPRWALGLTAACVTGLIGCVSPPSSAPSVIATRSAEAVAAGANVAFFALSLLGQPYTFGGRSFEEGFDCSGLVEHIYKASASVALSGSAAQMAKAARPIQVQDLHAGDLVFFNTLGRPFSHVGVYVGKNRFVHAASAKSGVRVDHLDHPYFAARFEGARSVLTH